MSLAVLVQKVGAGGVAIATDSAAHDHPGAVGRTPKLIPLSARLPLVFAGWGVYAIGGDPVPSVPTILADLRRRFDGETDTPELEPAAYQLADVARAVAEAIAAVYAPVFAGTDEGTGGFVADHTGGYRLLVCREGVKQCKLLWPSTSTGISASPGAGIVETRRAEVLPKLAAARGVTLAHTGILAAGLVADQIINDPDPGTGARFWGPVDLVLLSATGAEWRTIEIPGHGKPENAAAIEMRRVPWTPPRRADVVSYRQ